MIRTLTTLAAVAVLSAFAGCNNNKTTTPGAVSSDSSCCSTSGSCCATTAPGAVSSEKSCASSCASSCSDKMTTAPGAVSSDKDCASSCASSCSDKMTTAPGAVSSDKGCASSCSDKMSTTPVLRAVARSRLSRPNPSQRLVLETFRPPASTPMRAVVVWIKDPYNAMQPKSPPAGVVAMKTPLVSVLVLITCLSAGCAQNLWWEAERSGWVLYGSDVQVPRKADALPLNMLPQASTWNQSVYVEAWIESVDQESGRWMTISDGTTAPVLVFFEQGSIPRNARGRRVMTHDVFRVDHHEDGATRSSTTIEFAAKAVLIQGFYGLEQAPPRAAFSDERPMVLPETVETEPLEDDSRSEEDMMLDLLEQGESK